MNGRNPTRREKEIISRRPLKPENWLVIRTFPNEIHIQNREGQSTDRTESLHDRSVSSPVPIINLSSDKRDITPWPIFFNWNEMQSTPVSEITKLTSLFNIL